MPLPYGLPTHHTTLLPEFYIHLRNRGQTQLRTTSQLPGEQITTRWKDSSEHLPIEITKQLNRARALFASMACTLRNAPHASLQKTRASRRVTCVLLRRTAYGSRTCALDAHAARYAACGAARRAHTTSFARALRGHWHAGRTRAFCTHIFQCHFA